MGLSGFLREIALEDQIGHPMRASKQPNAASKAAVLISAGARSDTIKKRAHHRLSKLSFKTEADVDDIIHPSSTNKVGIAPDDQILEDDTIVHSFDLVSPDFTLNSSTDYECVFSKEHGETSRQIPERRVLSVLCPSKKFPDELHRIESVKEVANAVEDLRRMPKVVMIKTMKWVKVPKKVETNVLGTTHTLLKKETRNKINKNALKVEDWSDDEEEKEFNQEKYVWETLSEAQKLLLLGGKARDRQVEH
jgi:hypothetical protein